MKKRDDIKSFLTALKLRESAVRDVQFKPLFGMRSISGVWLNPERAVAKFFHQEHKLATARARIQRVQR